MQGLFLEHLTGSGVFFTSLNLLHSTLESGNNPGKTECILKSDLLSCSLSSPQKKSQQEDSEEEEEEEEEENAPQWNGSSETWRIAASVTTLLYNVFPHEVTL